MDTAGTLIDHDIAWTMVAQEDVDFAHSPARISMCIFDNSIIGQENTEQLAASKYELMHDFRAILDLSKCRMSVSDPYHVGGGCTRWDLIIHPTNIADVYTDCEVSVSEEADADLPPYEYVKVFSAVVGEAGAAASLPDVIDYSMGQGVVLTDTVATPPVGNAAGWIFSKPLLYI
jgi:hypothetical protein